jgi:hypothetical protein
MSRWKKLAYSFGSVMVGTATFATVLGVSSGHPTVGGTFVMFAAAVAGWIVAIPLIFKINNVSGWRFWLYLGIGSLSGPIIAFVALLVPFIKHATRIGHAQNSAVAFVTLITLGLFAIPFFVGTLTYLLWLRKAQTSVLKRINLAAVDR